MRDNEKRFKLHIYESALGENEKDHLLALYESGMGKKVLIATAATIALTFTGYVASIAKERRDWKKFITNTESKMSEIESKFQDLVKVNDFDRNEAASLISSYKSIGKEIESRYYKYKDEIQTLESTVQSYKTVYEELKLDNNPIDYEKEKKKKERKDVEKALKYYTDKLTFARTRFRECEGLYKRYERLLGIMEHKLY